MKTIRKAGKTERLQSILAHSGVSSRRGAVRIIEDGRVKIDGIVVRERGFHANPLNQKITVDGKPIFKSKEKSYFIFNKPAGVVTTLKDTHAERKVSDYFKDIEARIYPVGRLDKNTTGLILLTDDGELAYRLSHPRFEIRKEYLVWVSGGLNNDKMLKLRSGIVLDGSKTRPCLVSMIRKEGDLTKFKVVLHEGKKRQIRRMFKAVGNKVVKLKRSNYAGLMLGTLGDGKRRKLNDREVKSLKEMVGLS